MSLAVSCFHTTEKITLASVLSLTRLTLGFGPTQSETQTAAIQYIQIQHHDDYPGHLVSKPEVSKPEISLELVGTLVINERGVSIEGEWGSNEKFALHSSNSETTLFHSKALSFKGSFVWNKTKVVEDGVELSFSHQLNSSNILIEGHGMNKLGLFKISGVGEKNGEDSTTYKVKLSKTLVYFFRRRIPLPIASYSSS